MRVVNIHEAKTHFSRLLARVHSGEEIIIAKAGQPIVKMMPLAPVKKRVPGIAKAAVTELFFEPLPEKELKVWED